MVEALAHPLRSVREAAILSAKPADLEERALVDAAEAAKQAYRAERRARGGDPRRTHRAGHRVRGALQARPRRRHPAASANRGLLADVVRTTTRVRWTSSGPPSRYQTRWSGLLPSRGYRSAAASGNGSFYGTRSPGRWGSISHS